jgi:hypothetical protein
VVEKTDSEEKEKNWNNINPHILIVGSITNKYWIAMLKENNSLD